jgi:hypothetical protein
MVRRMHPLVARGDYVYRLAVDIDEAALLV